jgi:hypothetical protein
MVHNGSLRFQNLRNMGCSTSVMLGPMLTTEIRQDTHTDSPSRLGKMRWPAPQPSCRIWGELHLVHRKIGKRLRLPSRCLAKSENSSKT